MHEPVVLTLSIVNHSADAAHVDLGRDRKEAILVYITPPSKRKITYSWPRREGLSRRGDFDVGSGEMYTQTYVLNEGYDFDALGSYDIEASLEKSILINGVAATRQSEAFRASIEIADRNEQALRKRCDTIFIKANDPSSYERAAEAAVALSYVKDPVAVPYLQKLLAPNTLVEPIAISGLERIATLEAVKALGSILNAREENTSVLARAALLRMENESSDPDVRQEIRRVIKEAENSHS
ncbi:MAG: hypothetical protein WA789_16145 [Candidatus Acidiferrum sp.]